MMLPFLPLGRGIGFFAVVAAVSSSHLATALEPIARRVPPVGLEIPADVLENTDNALKRLRAQFLTVQGHPSSADVDVLLKSVHLAVTQNEIYKPEDLGLLAATLQLAEERLERLKAGEPSWQHDPLTVRGFYSAIDDSPQPYGLVIPPDLPRDRPVPLYVWLHGRGDKTTDIHFIKQRLEKVGQIAPPGAIVVHPFGRQCLGFKSAGETDVFEAIDHVKENYHIDPSRIVLMGFSMGGAGAWHIGAHYADQFAAISPGAGFAETAKYNGLSEDQMAAIPPYEQHLWRLYDVPNYVRNLFQVPVICYSGENDKQIQAGRVMEQAFLDHDKVLAHVIGPGMGHKYHPDSLAQIMTSMQDAVAQPKPETPRMVRLQTQTLRYPRSHWLRIDRLHRHWADSTVTAEAFDDWIRVSTGSNRRSPQPIGEPGRLVTKKQANDAIRSNVVQMTIAPVPGAIRYIRVDGQKLRVDEDAKRIVLSREDTSTVDFDQGGIAWRVGAPDTDQVLVKTPGLQGPIDDAFLSRFIVVTPTGKSTRPKIDAWVEFELDHLRSRWSTLFRGTLPEKPDHQITERDIQEAHLIVFGDPTSNSILSQVLDRLPLRWDTSVVSIGEHTHALENCVPVLIYPNPLNRDRYLVINSGPTFREGHDRTNSLQNPKLPDWALLDISAGPNDLRAGQVMVADFFDEYWLPR